MNPSVESFAKTLKTELGLEGANVSIKLLVNQMILRLRHGKELRSMRVKKILSLLKRFENSFAELKKLLVRALTQAKKIASRVSLIPGIYVEQVEKVDHNQETREKRYAKIVSQKSKQIKKEDADFVKFCEGASAEYPKHYRFA